jgi:hypothetical protein
MSAFARAPGVGNRKTVAVDARLFHRTPSAVAAALCAWLAVVPAAIADVGPADVTAAAIEHGSRSSDPAQVGIWKAAVPPAGSMHGEFDNNDPIGLTAGVRIAADCSINWVDPDDKKLYCFSSATSLVFFLDAPQDFLRRAREEWRHLRPSLS